MENVKFLCMDRTYVESTLSTYEQVANYVGLIPFISSGSGTIRMLIGIIQILGGLWNRDSEMISHGGANFARGSIETTWIFSIIFSYIYDGKLEKRLRYKNDIQIPNPWQLLRTISSRI